MSKISSKSRECAVAIGNRQEFDTYGALRAQTFSAPYGFQGDCGQLNATEHAALDADRRSIRYIVFSYSTPIAWVTEAGSVHKVQQKFSMTTSHHQGKLYLL